MMIALAANINTVINDVEKSLPPMSPEESANLDKSLDSLEETATAGKFGADRIKALKEAMEKKKSIKRLSPEDLADSYLGIPSSIPLLTLAAEVFPAHAPRALQAASKIGEVIWKQNLKGRGRGICNGITGSAYSLHCLSRALNNAAN
jgi:hypothetical protein